MSGTAMDTGTTDPGDKSSAQIEREVEGSRARLAQNLDALRESVSPGHLMDQVVDYVRGSGGTEFAQSLGRAVRDNPLPVLLIGAGVGWLLLSGGRSSGSGGSGTYEKTSTSGASHDRASYGRGAAAALVPQDTSYNVRHGQDPVGVGQSLVERAGSAASGVGERVGGAASQAYRTVAGAAGSAADGVGSAAGSVAQSVSEAAGTVVRQASGLGQDLRHQASRAGDSAQQGLDWLLREQPLVVGAVGVALGAALGALLPGTEAEDRLLGETSDALTRQAKDVASQGYQQVQQVAGEQIDRAKGAAAGAYDATKGQAEQSGLSAGKAADAVGSAAQQVREAVREGARAVADQARDAIDRVDPAKGGNT